MTAGPGSAPPAGQASADRTFGWRIGGIRGIPVYLGRSWPVVAIAVVVLFGPNVRDSVGASGGVFGYAVAVAYAVLLLFSVLAHEAAHALSALAYGYRVDRIVADLWGGHTVYDSSTSRPGPSAGIAVAGPLANLAIAGVGYAVTQLLQPDGVLGLLLGALTLTNLFVGAFNLLPGLPLDGGYLVDALVWRVTGDRNRGLIVAGWLGRILTMLVVLWFVGRPLLLGQSPSLYTIIWCGLIGAFLWSGASNAIRSGTSRRAIESVPLSRVLRPAVLVGDQESVAAALSRVDGAGAGVRRDTGLLTPGSGRAGMPVAPLAVVVTDAGQPVGLLDVDTARGIDHERWSEVRVQAVTHRQPDGWVVAVPSRDVDVSGVVGALVSRPDQVTRTILAVGPTGEVLGTVTVDDLNAAFTA
ncbi:MAG: site-2 protease family protein [Actinomycetota bacterium]|nr:site-2 protease family protein [Actinomycetota bacterium]